MIVLERARLTPKEAERWRAALAEPAAIARPARHLASEILAMCGVVCMSIYVISVGMFPDGGALPTALRAFLVGGWAWMLLVGARLGRARRDGWRPGRSLYGWGYAELDDETLRIVPIRALTLELRGRRSFFGSIRLVVSAPDVRTTFRIHLHELDAVERLLEARDGEDVPFATLGYRDAPRRPEGLAGRVGSWWRAIEIGAAVIAGCLGTLGPLLFPLADITRPRTVDDEGDESGADVRDTRDDEVRLAELEHALDPCTSDLVQSTVESYLTLALESPRLGPARPYALPMLALRPGHGRIWTRCTWEVDRRSGLFAHADARWGVDRDGVTRLERRARVETSDVLRVIGACPSSGGSTDVSPHAITWASMALLSAAIVQDLAAGSGATLPAAGPAAEGIACALRHSHVEVMHVRDP